MINIYDVKERACHVAIDTCKYINFYYTVLMQQTYLFISLIYSPFILQLLFFMFCDTFLNFKCKFTPFQIKYIITVVYDIAN
jgi:hypothetical protein